MKIGLLSTSFPMEADRTSGAFVEGFARGLAACGHTVHVLAPRPHTGSAARQPSRVDVTLVDYAPRALRRTFHDAGVLDNVRATALAWPGLATFPLALVRAAREHVRGWDAVVSHFALPCALVAGAVRGARPHLAVMHSGDLHLLSRLPARARLAEAIEVGASALWFVSDVGRARYEAVLGRAPRPRVHVAPMGVDAGTTPPHPRPRARGAMRVLVIARLVPIKGVDVLLRALEGVSGVELDVVGDGPERRALESDARARALTARFHGARFDTAKQRLLEDADVLVVPSRVLADGRTEGAPVVTLEAMVAGVPLVASAVGGIPELVGDAAWLVPPEDVDALRHAITTLRDEPSLRDTLAARGRARAEPRSWQATCATALALLAR